MVLCALAMLGNCPAARGGHAVTIPPPRGGAAEIAPEPVRMLERFSSWVCIHNREGRWNDTGDPYWGGLQMDRGFMSAYGSDAMARHDGGLADTWTPAEQIVVAERAYRSGRGFGPWPNTARDCGFSTGRVAPEGWLSLPLAPTPEL